MKNTNEISNRTFDSMRAASAGLNVAISVLKRAKAAGCHAFRSGRIYEKPLNEWLAANPSASLPSTKREAVEIKHILLQCEKLQIAIDALKTAYVLRSEFEEWLAKHISDLKHNVQMILCNQMPLRLSGLRPEEMRPVLDDAFRRFCDAMERGVRAE